jgi:hypothetical protein
MKRWQIGVLLVLACSVAATAGYWAGFREAWTLGTAVDTLPRGARSVAHLEALHAGKLRPVLLGLEFDVDNGLVWGYEVMSHPLRELWAPLWGLEIYPGYERHLTRLANYRREHPSSTRSEMFESAPESRPDLRDAVRDFSRSAREVAARRDEMVERYATRKRP